MESAQQAEEELQQSVVVSEEDMEGDDIDAMEGCNERRSASPSSCLSDSVGEEIKDAQDVAGSSAWSPEQSSEQQQNSARDAGSAPDVDDGSDDTSSSLGDGDTKQEAWADGDGHRQNALSYKGDHDIASNDSESSASASSGEDADEEAVGAVKIRPGDMDDDVSHDSESDGTEETESAEAWEDAQNEDVEGDEDSEAVASNTCIFCKQDEEHDPGEEYEELLECNACGEYSHQFCARQANAVEDETSVNWTCPGCASAEPGVSRNDDDEETSVTDPGMSQLPDSSSAEANGQSTVAVMRKRRTSPVSTEEPSMSLRKRHRKTADGPDHSSATANPEAWPKEVPEADQSRRQRLKVPHKYPPVTLLRGPQSLIVTIRASPSRLQEVLASPFTSSRKRISRPGTSRATLEGVHPAPLPFLSAAVQPFYSFLDRDTDDLKSKPYGGILSDTNADTSKTLPAPEDRRRFDEAKQQAEEEWRVLHAADSAMQRLEQRKKHRKSGGPASQIECIEFGGWEIDTWYAAPYPEEYSRNRTLYICEFCLKYMNSDYVAWRHKLKCPAKHPPGDEIYRHGSVSVFEVDGRKNPVYCQNLCLLAKLFLGSKTLYYDVEPFLFYVLCEHDDLGYHFVGYFSKEKRVSSQNNVSCILTLPIHQRKGYGNLLIDFSYLLTRVERKTGSPEKPLSDMGLVSYRNYWRLVMCQYLLSHWTDAYDAEVPTGFSIRNISDETGLTPDDVISALEGLRCLAKDAQTGLYAFRVDLGYCREYLSKWEGKGYVQLRPDALTWTPYVMGRGNATNFELGPAITAIAPREEDGDPKAPPVNGETSSLGMLKNPSMAVEPDSFQLIPRTHEATGDGPLGNDTRQHGDLEIRHSTEPCEVELTSGPESGPPITRWDEAPDTPCATQHWAASYQDIPPSRFEVFPTLAGRRIDRPRNAAPRPSLVRPASDLARPKPPGNSSHRRSTTSRPKSASSSRRKTGGTGRGPGRWPKGTKKSDYGNASSGPGLPPGWIKEKQRADIIGPGTEGESLGTMEIPAPMDTVSVRFDEGVEVAGAKGKESPHDDLDHS